MRSRNMVKVLVLVIGFALILALSACGDDGGTKVVEVCPASQIKCGGICIDPNTDRTYCGASGDCQGDNAGTVCADGEVCDGATCTDINECTLGTDNCDVNATCTNTPGSFTCACNAGWQGDGVTCVPLPTVAVYGCPGTASWLDDVRDKIANTGMFMAVDSYFIDPASTPTLFELVNYDAVLFFSDSSLWDGTAVGDVLANYMDAGGGVVLCTFAYNTGTSLGIAGRIESDGYLPFTRDIQSSGGPLTLVAAVPDHPILNNVASFNGGTSSFHEEIDTTAWATLVAHWSNDYPLVAAGKPTAGRIVGLNFFPPSSDVLADFWDSSTDGDWLMANALRWAVEGTFQLVLELTPPDGTLMDDIDVPNWAMKGYRFTPSQDIQLTGAEWWINLPVGGTIAARLYDYNTEALLASGTVVGGDGTEQWYRSDISYTLSSGTEYVIAFYNTASTTSIFDYMQGPTQPFDIPPYMTNVTSRSSGNTTTDQFPGSLNTWAPFIRIVVE